MANTVIATSTFGRKVHIAPFGRLDCGNSGSIDTVLADLGDEGGLEATIEGLAAAHVAPSRLCCKCFMARTRGMYAERCAR